MLTRITTLLGGGPPMDAFGLDIGSTSVKALELRTASPSLSVARCAVTPLPLGAVTEGTIHVARAVSDAIRVCLDKAGIARRGAVIGLCGRELIVKKMQIPEVPVKDLPSVIRIEAEHEIPFAIGEVVLDYHVIGRQNGQLELALVAAKKSKVTEYHSAVAAAGLDPLVVDVDGFALGNQFQLHPRPGLTAMVDIGATMTKVSVVGHGHVHFVRDVPFGGHRCTKAIAARLGVSVERAEALKIDPAPAPEAVREARAALAQELALELQRTLDYCAASGMIPTSITGIALAGGSAQLTGLAEYLATTLDLPVEIASPFHGLQVDATCADTVTTAGPALALALGLSLRRPRTGRRP
jgi:type IV pilus assembly protein PilM